MLLPILTKQCEVLNSYFSVNSFHNWTSLLPSPPIKSPYQEFLDPFPHPLV